MKTVRNILVIGNIAFVALTKGRVAIIDAADVGKVDGGNWSATIGQSNSYARRGIWSGKKCSVSTMHRVIMDAPDDLQVDHIDGDGLNNRRSNLRFATPAQNSWNKRKARNNTSGYRGVSFRKDRGHWQATITVYGVRKRLGSFKTAYEAQCAYAAEARRHHGEFARP